MSWKDAAFEHGPDCWAVLFAMGAALVEVPVDDATAERVHGEAHGTEPPRGLWVVFDDIFGGHHEYRRAMYVGRLYTTARTREQQGKYNFAMEGDEKRGRRMAGEEDDA